MKGQVNMQMPFPLPALFFEFEPADMKTIGRKVQKSENSTVTVYLVCNTKLKTSTSTKETLRSLALDNLELLDAVNFRLQGFRGDCFDSLDRTGFAPYQYRGHVIRHGMVYRTSYTDNSAKHNTINKNGLELNPTITNS